MPKKTEINYASLFNLRADGRYQKSIILNGKKTVIYDRDPEKLYNKLQELENPSAPAFKRVAEAWHDEHWRKITYGTQSCYEARFNDAISYNAEKLITDITAADIDRHLKQLATKGFSAKSIKTQCTVYKLIFNFAILSEETWLKGFVTVNPVTAIAIPRGLPKKKREAPEDDVIKIIRKSVDCYFGIFPYLLIYTGLRKGEALALTWGDIDYKNKLIKCLKSVSWQNGMPVLGTTKTASGLREVPLLAGLEKVLIRPKDAKDNDPIFHQENGNYLGQTAYERRWLHYCKDTGLVTTEETKKISKQNHEYTHIKYRPAITAHQLRHGFATILFEAGVDEYTAQRLLGHADIKTTRAIYTHLRDKQKNKSLTKLEEYMESLE